MRSSQTYPKANATPYEELDTIYDPDYVESVTQVRDFLKNQPHLTVVEFDNFCSKHPEAYLLFFANPSTYPFATEQFINEYKAMEDQRIADAKMKCLSPTLGQKDQDASTNLACAFFQPAQQPRIPDPLPESPTRLNMTTD